MAFLELRSTLLAAFVLAAALKSCESSLEAIKGLRGGRTVVFGPNRATDDETKLHRPVAEVEAELAMVCALLTPSLQLAKTVHR